MGLNARSFGAMGDGATDDTAALQAAIDEAQNSRRRLLVPAGRYLIRGTLHVRCYDSDSIRGLSFLPRDVVVVGGGIIAVEFARIFAALDAQVTMLMRSVDPSVNLP